MAHEGPKRRRSVTQVTEGLYGNRTISLQLNDDAVQNVLPREDTEMETAVNDKEKILRLVGRK